MRKRNLSYKLYDLFREYIKRKEKESHIYVNTHTSYHYPAYSGAARAANSWMHKNDNYEGVIYFYEWSDTNREPMLFYNINAFDAFLRRSEIFIPPFQKDVIRQLDRAYISCKKGTHDVIIRGSRAMLDDALRRADSVGVDMNTVSSAIPNRPVPAPGLSIVNPNYNPANLNLTCRPDRMPPMYAGCQNESWYT
jgi:hypothetical protein